jgi:hypothetical protein
MHDKPKEASLFTGKIVTKGRTTGHPRTVELRLVYVDGRFYVSSTSLDKKHWCKNMINEPSVEVLYGGARIPCTSSIISNAGQRAKVLRIRGAASGDDRTIFEMTPRED